MNLRRSEAATKRRQMSGSLNVSKCQHAAFSGSTFFNMPPFATICHHAGGRADFFFSQAAALPPEFRSAPAKKESLRSSPKAHHPLRRSTMRFERGLCYPPTFTMKRPDRRKRRVFPVFFACYGIGFFVVSAYRPDKNNHRSSLKPRPPESEETAQASQKRAPAPVTIRRNPFSGNSLPLWGTPLKKIACVCGCRPSPFPKVNRPLKNWGRHTPCSF